jgi:hypothetical protein
MQTARARSIVAGLVLAAVPTVAAAAEPPRILFAPDPPTDSEIVRATVLGENAVACGAAFFAYVDPAAARVRLLGYSPYPPVACDSGWWTAQAVIGHLRPGVWAVEATLDDQPYATSPLTVVPSPTRVVIGSFEYFGTNFRIEVEWRDPRTGELHLAPGVALSDRAAQFWFFDAGNPELTLKILDGRALNGHHWLFASTLTNVETTLRIMACTEGDPPNCSAPKEYRVPAGATFDIVDLTAF